ncbi:replicative DNA helicase [Orrella dioscoreae]|uniref:Replicative DNA helicase n=1 Tax=Orrella dioscoreae TaxID=1851544 RepID=A0A1C3K1G1_9BURK|nr:replicative DNA helicase [Orrella dioscoreae]SBT25321.1 Replicative DNA helicase [Orrella dioscoreae]SOE49109.1 Replicative DNA helicase [Orrella dioscoreae]
MIANLDAEQAVIGALLLDNGAFDRMGHLEAEHFFRADHRAIFREVSSSILRGQSVDVLTLMDRLEGTEASDPVYLHTLAANTPSAANIARYASIVKEKAQRRELARASAVAADLAENDMSRDAASLIDGLQGELERLAESRSQNEPVRVDDDLIPYLTELEERAEGKVALAIPTGFPDLDKRLNGGIRRGELMVVAARPKMGKSALAFNIALNASVDHSVLILSMEMPRKQIHDRNVSVLTKIPLSKLLNPSKFDQSDWTELTSAVERLRSRNLSLDDQGGLRLMDVRAKARQTRRKHGLDLLVIDYLQLMEGEGDNRNAQIEQITRGLKALAKEMGIGIVLLSQLNRDLERRPNKRPMPADLRDSGAIEQDCDIALFLYRDEVYNPDSRDKGICEVNVGLIRQGEPGVVGLVYEAERTCFKSLEMGRQFNQPEAEGKRVRYSALRD